MPGMYSTRHWRLIRDQQLRLEPTCAFCRQRGILEPATVADHVIPHRGDPALFYDVCNLQSLCVSCHSGSKARLECSGSLRGSDLQGYPLDRNSHWHREGDE